MDSFKALFSSPALQKALLGACLIWAFLPSKQNARFVVSANAQPMLKRGLERIQLKEFTVPNIFRSSWVQLGLLLFQVRIQSVLRPSKREFISLPRGDDVGLDWFFPDNGPYEGVPIVIYIAGIAGTLREGVGFVRTIQRKGWIAVVFHRSGHAAKLKTPTFNLFGSALDLRVAVEQINREYPQSPVALVGSSAGSALTIRYLGQFAHDPRVVAGVGLSPGYSIDQLWKEITGSFFDRYLLGALQSFFVRRNKSVLESRNSKRVQDMLEASTVYEFLNHAVHFSTDERKQEEIAEATVFKTWFDQTSPNLVSDNIQTPLLCLNALDDPICQRKLVEEIGYRIPEENSYTALLVTENGSHCAHQTFSGGWPKNWGYTVAIEFIEGVISSSTM